MKKINVLYYILGGFAFSIFIYFLSHGFPSFKSGQSASQLIQSAETNYAAGERGKTIAERKEAFNQALTDYLQLSQSFQPDEGNGKLYYNIGNTYFQLGEYPLAIYYYEKALSLNPRDEKIASNLTLTLDKLGSPHKKEDSTFQQIFFFHHYLSVPERRTLFFFFSLLTFIALSLVIWFRQRLLQYLAILFGGVALVLLGSLLYTQYMSPMEAILVQPAFLFRDAGEEYAKVEDKPLSAGKKVEVLDIKQRGLWIKILTPEGKLGFVKKDSLKII